MTTLIQPASNVSGTKTVTPLYVVRQVSQNESATPASVVTPSSITTLGLGSTTDSTSLTYDAVSLLQSFSPTFSVSGLTPAQQKQLALALGLNENASSSDLTNAINALLTPANPANELLNIMVGGSTTASNPTTPGLLDNNGEIAGLAGSSSSQATDTVLSTLFALGTTTATTTATNSSQINAQSVVSTSQTAESATPALAGAVSKLNHSVSIGTQGEAASVPAFNPALIRGNSTEANASVSGTENPVTEAATTLANSVPNHAQVSVENASAAPSVRIEAQTAGISSSNSTASNNATTESTLASLSTGSAELTQTSVTLNNLNPGMGESIAPTALSTLASNIVGNEAATVVLPTVNAESASLSVPLNISFVASATSTIASAANSATALTAISPAANATAASGIATEVTAFSSTYSPATVIQTANIPFTASPASLPSTAIAASGANADNELQVLMNDAAAHALGVANQAAANYSLAGTIVQLSSGIDHTRQASLKGKLPDIRNTINPLAPIKGVRGSLDR